MNIIIQISYLVASVLFIIGIKMLGRTKTARKGNIVSSVGMFIAILATVIQVEAISLIDIFICILIGSVIGIIIAIKVQMTKIPEMVALFNGFGGLASLSVAFSDFWFNTQIRGVDVDMITGISVALSILIGGITFTGSLVAFMKLNGSISGRAIVFSGQHLINLILLLLAIAITVFALTDFANPTYIIVLGVIALALGLLVVIPIGGADMPVVISLLNSYSGMAACATGFVLNNNVLIVSGALVGASGIILTQIMCKAMNRSLANVLLGGFGQTSAGGAAAADGPQIVVKEVGVEEAAQIFDSVSSLIIVPGYGMAVAQAQHTIRELSELCEKKGINVRFAIHPVAGRMPGHMNVLLAEANVSYDKLIEMDEINDDFANTDLVFVVGANDVVNPAAKTNPSSPIFGMPVLNVEKAQTVIVSKRSMGKGYAGIENELFGADNCLMLFGDAKQTITKLVGEIKEL
ncbi:NAD(P)(+) transhydrogenase (Re/Si-specific) subunit beta [Sphingobacterium sp. FBM7-1]|uniref:NAD(P)(+) transhydrogenase (Re/Si-specific) subunit beta n=1 Tax=Sphingobacterium sp. FBM7-1 TaxID=2886688 RepID=UPI001D12A916|nr:NAD(P)(+) transhydrogenase (Re/Si-specific) subunit beta [Sphingobacterium sp. FBM7-1]MCC2599565.1 NAD(P)(+) transhydrogenase (Re/Si-specific) subunit beta [Sphingobacterium sp. FBM7-1]